MHFTIFQKYKSERLLILIKDHRFYQLCKILQEQRDMSANWLPVPENQVPSNPRPGSCFNDTKSLSDSYINFIKTHTLMDDSVRCFQIYF